MGTITGGEPQNQASTVTNALGLDVGPNLEGLLTPAEAARWPHLAEMIDQARVMQANAVPWHLIRWHRAHRRWKRALAGHRAQQARPC